MADRGRSNFSWQILAISNDAISRPDDLFSNAWNVPHEIEGRQDRRHFDKQAFKLLLLPVPRLRFLSQ